MANTDKMSEEKVVKLEAEKSDRKDQVQLHYSRLVDSSIPANWIIAMT